LILVAVLRSLTSPFSLSLTHSIIKKYSAFVAFPVKVNGETVNTVQAIWAMEKTAVTEEQYNDFYR
jgi:HSP90 family molecular chaperone